MKSKKSNPAKNPRLALSFGMFIAALLAAHAAGLAAGAAPAAADWPTGRGNPQRTGNLDDQPGPAQPKVLWVYKSAENFISPAVPAGSQLIVAGLGAFNSAAVHGLSIEESPAQRERWAKNGLRMPVVCPPAVAGGLVFFGDGMHQTDGATLYCMKADSGIPLWQYALPGKLIHLEGAVTFDSGRVYTGGGNAGVICVDAIHVTLDGHAQDLAAVQPQIEKRWAEMLAKYEQDKKKDGNLAVAPSDEALPHPAPNLLWQQGKDKWHVDAPVLVTAGKVIAASAYLDDDKCGNRAVICMNAPDGSAKWEAKLKHNPWAGPTLAGDVVLVGCSSIRFDKKLVPTAQGEVVAVDLNSGQVRWRKDVPGGVLSTVAVKNNLAVFTATDGRIRAWDVATGAERWVYAGKAPFFAGVAIAGNVVYAADLSGILHGVSLTDGKGQWKLDVGIDPAVQAPGEVYGSPVVSGGRIYLATCNMDSEGASAEQSNVVICLADHAGVSQQVFDSIAVDKQKKTILIPAKIAPRKLPSMKDIYPIEVVACYPVPVGQKAHETVVTFNVKPSDIDKALRGLGLTPGKPARGEGQVPSGPIVGLYLVLPGVGDKQRIVPIERAMQEPRTGKPLPHFRWRFTGSVLRQPDPTKDFKMYGADLTGTLVSIFPVTDETVFQSDLTMKEEPFMKLETNKNLLPEEGTAVQILIQVLPSEESSR